ncbi:MAG: PilZ domain-containing protein [Elusimicrobiota bacterium]
MTKENRRSLRISCSVPVLVRVTKGEPAEAWGIIYDISLVGIKLETRKELENKETVFLSFTLGQNFIFENARGTVVRVSKNAGYSMVGIEFDLAVDKNHLKDALVSLIEG